MKYIEVSLSHIHPDKNELLMARLADIGFESFMETEEGLQGYIQEPLFNEDELKNTLLLFENEKIEVTILPIADQNWNAVWESNFQPVMVNEMCYIRAPFHPENPQAKFDIIIEPKMSFGTAHHETTANMIELLLNENLNAKKVLDMGCGTGVLAILAEKLGASSITAIDNDSWAYENTLENIERNQCTRIKAFMGDAALLIKEKFDIIIANINRNILLADMDAYVKVLNSEGILMMSGFYEEDIPLIEKKANELGLTKSLVLTKNRWVAALFNLN